MISKLMPLPMPYSSICSPSHIRKTVPAVMVNTAVSCQPNSARWTDCPGRSEVLDSDYRPR